MTLTSLKLQWTCDMPVNSMNLQWKCHIYASQQWSCSGSVIYASQQSEAAVELSYMPANSLKLQRKCHIYACHQSETAVEVSYMPVISLKLQWKCCMCLPTVWICSGSAVCACQQSEAAVEVSYVPANSLNCSGSVIYAWTVWNCPRSKPQDVRTGSEYPGDAHIKRWFIVDWSQWMFGFCIINNWCALDCDIQPSTDNNTLSLTVGYHHCKLHAISKRGSGKKVLFS